jgi:cell division protein FtsN
MSDFRNPGDFQDPRDPYRDDSKFDPGGANNTAWGWIAAAVFVLVIIAVGFGLGHKPGEMNTASNDKPAMTDRMAPPAPMPAPSMAPAPATPSAPVTPTAPASGNGQ